MKTATTTFTTRIESGLKKRLEKIATYEDRSASYIANQAILALVEEREATHSLMSVGLTLIESDTVPVLSEESITKWIEEPSNSTFPRVDAHIR